MKAASLKEIKQELQSLEPETVQELVLRLARYKKESKELLAYLLFESSNEHTYIENVKEEVTLLFQQIPQGNVYYTKKSLRKILRFVNRQIKYSGIRQTELALRIFFCEQMKEAGIPMQHGTVLFNLNQQQLQKISTVLSKMPEDLQADYQREVDSL